MATPAADRRTRLLQTAAELFFTQPYDSVTTTEIASRSGVAYGLIAHHFGNKRGLYLAAIRHAADRLVETEAGTLEGGTHLERLRHGIARHVDYAKAHAQEFHALMRGDLGSDPDVQAIVNELRRGAAHQALADLGVPDPAPPLLRAAVESWIVFLDNLVAEHIQTGAITENHIVDLASIVLVQAISSVQAQTPGLQLGVRPDDDLADLRRRIRPA